MYIDETESPTRTQNRDTPLANNLGGMTDEIPENIEIFSSMVLDIIFIV